MAPSVETAAKTLPATGPRNLWALIISGILVAWSGGLIGPALPLLLQSRGLDLADIGMVFAVGALLPVFLQPLLGILSDRLGRRVVLGPIRLLCGLTLLLVGLAVTPQLVALSLGARLALDQSTAPLLWAAVGDVSAAKQRASHLAWLSSAGSAAYVMALLASTLVLHAMTLRYAVLLSSGLLFGSGLALLALTENHHVAPRRKEAIWPTVQKALLLPLGYLRSQRSLAALFLYLFFRTIGVAVFPIYFPLLLLQLGAKPSAIGPIIATSWLAYALAQPLGGRFADRLLLRKRIIAAGTSGMVVATAAMALAAQLPHPAALAALVAAWIVIALPDGLSQPALSALQLDLAPAKERGGFIGTLGTVSTLGNVVAPLLYGAVAHRLSLLSAFAVSAGALLLSLGALFFVPGGAIR